METGSAVIWDIRKAAGRENSWWIDHEPSATNETDHTCYFLTSDADGQRLDTLGASANGAAVRVSSYACPGVWGGQKNAQFKLIEARCGGYVKNSKKTAKIGDSVTCVGSCPIQMRHPRCLLTDGRIMSQTARSCRRSRCIAGM